MTLKGSELPGPPSVHNLMKRVLESEMLDRKKGSDQRERQPWKNGQSDVSLLATKTGVRCYKPRSMGGL